MKKLISQQIWKDLNASLVVFLVALPLCLGIALASKAPIMSGIIAGIIGGMVVGMLGGSRLGVSGPAAGLVATTLAGIAALGSFEAFCLATMLAGLFQVALSLLKAGTLARFFPTGVIKGMLAAIGIIIILKQIPHLVGLDRDYEGDLDFFQADGHTTLSEFQYLLESLTPGAVLLGGLGLLVMIVWNLPFLQRNKYVSMIPGALLAVAIGIVGQLVLEVSHSPLALAPEHLVQITASSNPLNWVTLPNFSSIGNGQVWAYALIIGLVASVESLLCAEATDKIDPKREVANKNRELFAQGIGNFLAGLAGGLPVTQVVVRSSANVHAGAQTRLSSVFHGFLILFTVVATPALLNEIPMTSLAAVLILVGYNLAKPSLLLKYYKKGWSEFIPFVTTIFAVLFSDLLIGVGIGICMALFFILRRNFRAPYSYQLRQSDSEKVVEIKLASIVGFFNKGVIIETLETIPHGSRVILDASEAGFIDPDIVEVIENFAKTALDHNIRFELVGTLDHNLIAKNPAKDLKREISLAAK